MGFLLFCHPPPLFSTGATQVGFGLHAVHAAPSVLQSSSWTISRVGLRHKGRKPGALSCNTETGVYCEGVWCESWGSFTFLQMLLSRDICLLVPRCIWSGTEEVRKEIVFVLFSEVVNGPYCLYFRYLSNNIFLYFISPLFPFSRETKSFALWRKKADYSCCLPLSSLL